MWYLVKSLVFKFLRDIIVLLLELYTLKQLSSHSNLFESMMHRPKMICRNFLYGNSHQQLHELIGNYKRVFSKVGYTAAVYTRYT